MSTDPRSLPGPAGGPWRSILTGGGRACAILALAAAGIAGNLFHFTFFYNFDFIFGSICSLLVLQLYGPGPGVAAALVISAPLYLVWGHPYAIPIMAAETAVVGWLNSRHRVGFLQADVIYWLAVGAPLVYLSYHLAMHVPATSTLAIMAKDAVNGLANTLIARLGFAGWGYLARRRPLSYRETLYNLLALFVLAPTLVMVGVESRRDFANTERTIQRTLLQETHQTTEMLSTWVAARRLAIARLAAMATDRTPREMQPFLDLARASDANYLRIGLQDREATVVAYSPPFDDLGRNNLGRSFADRSYLPQLKLTLKPMLGEGLQSRSGSGKPVIPVLAPVLKAGRYAGYVGGALDLEPIQGRLRRALEDQGTLFTLVDRFGQVLMTNRADQKVMGPLARGPGGFAYVDGRISHWVPAMGLNTPSMERWARTLYLTESPIGSVTDWTLTLEQPVAPFQQALFVSYLYRFSILFGLLMASLTAAEVLSRLYSSSLRESEAKFRTVADHTYDWEMWFSPGGAVIYCSPSCERITGLAPEAYLADADIMERLLHPDDLPRWRAHLHPAGGLPQDENSLLDSLRIIRPDGQTRWIDHHCHSILDRDGRYQGRRISNRDVTERKLAAEHQRALEAQLQQSQKMESLGVLVAGVAHNINNVLAIVMGTASLREQFVAEPSDREAYQSIGKVCMRGREVVKSLIHFAQPTLAVRAPLELHSLIREVCGLLDSTSRNRVRIVEAFAPEPLWINGDAGSINHALVNLCLNALDAMPDGGLLTLRTAILAGDRVEVAVEDDGAGMAPEVLGHVLEPFYTTKEVGKGTGLGLSMTYGVITAHGGSIDLASQPGQGTTVTLRFPRIQPPAPNEPVKAAAPALGGLNVFLVDDDEDVRFLMTRMLKKAGVRQVKTFSGGEAAVRSLGSGERPDLVILDQNMPGMNGIQTMAKVRAMLPEMPILISSGQPDIEDWDEFKGPLVSVLSKPFTMEEIQAKLGRFARPAAT